ncbi:MAG: hypothetical protein CM15mP8_2310 [Methanobacteriota archaeon]|nr:MAG: hypothetical protein CM15mP8_2310 [Euryarchaeota archaeon]
MPRMTIYIMQKNPPMRKPAYFANFLNGTLPSTTCSSEFKRTNDIDESMVNRLGSMVVTTKFTSVGILLRYLLIPKAILVAHRHTTIVTADIFTLS